jgi:hypothetical protein
LTLDLRRCSPWWCLGPTRPWRTWTSLLAAIRAHLDTLHDLRDCAAVLLAPALATGGPPGVAFRELRRVYLQQWSGLVDLLVMFPSVPS